MNLSPFTVGKEERMLRLNPETGDDTSVQVPSPERSDEPAEAPEQTESLITTDEDASVLTQDETNDLAVELKSTNDRIESGAQQAQALLQQKDVLPFETGASAEKVPITLSSRENYEAASRMLMFLQDSGFMQKPMHTNKKDSLYYAADKQAEKAATKAEREKLIDPTNTESEEDLLFGTVDPTHERVKNDIAKNHESNLDYAAHTQKMEEYQDALSAIQRDPARNTLVLDEATVTLFDVQDYVQPDGEMFMATDPKELMTEIKTRMESFREGGKILYTKEKIMIEDTEHDDIPQETESILDAAKQTENGEWKIENGAAALEFIRNYAEPVEGDDFLEAEERSWRIPTQEYHRKEEDGANIEAEQKIQAFKEQAEANGADWEKIEPLLRACTAYREPNDSSATSRAYEQQREIFRLMYANAASTSPEVKRAYAMKDAISAVAEPPVSPLDSPQFLQEWNKASQDNDEPKKAQLQAQIDAFNQQFGAYNTKIQALKTTYPELPIPMNTGIGTLGVSGVIDTKTLLGIATTVLDREIASFVRTQPNMEHAVNDIYLTRDTQKYNEQEFKEEQNRPTRRGQLLDDIQNKGLGADGTLTLSNTQMDQFRSLVQRRATQTARVYRSRVHEVTSSGATVLDPSRLLKADASRILIPYRNPVFTQKFTQWETDHMQRDPEVVQGRLERFKALDSLNTLRDEFRSHLLDTHDDVIPEDVEEQLKAFEDLISENNILNLSAEELTPDQLTQFDERLQEAHDILTQLNEDNAPKGERHNPAKLEGTFDMITDDNFVTLAELEKDLQTLPADSEEATTLRALIEAGKKAGNTRTPTQVNGINLTFNRHGEIGIHMSNAKALLEKVHRDHLDIWSMDDVDMEAIAQARCPITMHETSLSPNEAQAFRSYNGPNAVLTLPNITTLSPQTIRYLAQNHCKLVMTATLYEELTPESIVALRQINKVRENDITLVIPKEASISKKTLQRYESLGRYRIKVKDLGATVTDGSEAKDETVTDESTASAVTL